MIPGKPTPSSLLGTGGGSEINRVRYRQAKETKCGGKDVRKSQCLESTEEAGELDPRGRWEASSTAIGTLDAASGNNTDNRPPFHVVAFIQRVEPWTQVT